jgi:hypothetical protein
MITSVQLTTTAANIIYGTSTQSKGITAMYLCNTNGTSATANVFLVPAGGTVADCRIYSNLSIAASDTHISDLERIVLDAGDSIWANASGNIVMTISSMGA